MRTVLSSTVINDGSKKERCDSGERCADGSFSDFFEFEPSISSGFSLMSNTCSIASGGWVSCDLWQIEQMFDARRVCVGQR
jgi:hypothetical protein